MIKKAVVMRKHLEVNRKDKDGKFRLILVESRIHRLARYYKVWYRQHSLDRRLCPLKQCVISLLCLLERVKKLAPNWKYESSTASALVA